MSCKSCGDHKDGCVCKKLKEIDHAQRYVQGKSEDLCECTLHSNKSNKDTIPFMLICSNKCEPFETMGDGFCTIFFRVCSIDSDCCATLELLKPDDCYGCGRKFPNLSRTDQCLTIELDCFCGVQCLKPIDGNEPCVSNTQYNKCKCKKK